MRTMWTFLPILGAPRAHRRGIVGLWSASAVVLSAGATAHAGLTYQTSPNPGGYIQACAGPTTPGSFPWPGADLTSLFGNPASDIHEQSFLGLTTASASAAYAGGNTSNSSSGSVGMGYAHMQAANNAPNNSFFAAGDVEAGWKDSFLISNPALTGQAGFMQFTLHVSGSLAAAGFAGASNFTVTGYKNTAQLMVNPLFSPGNSTLLSTDRQYGSWRISSDFSTESLAVLDTVTFAVPITFGTPFDLSIFARAHAGMRSSSSVGGNSTSSADFSTTLSWGGITNVYLGTTPGASYELVSGSGTDWTQPVVPAPGALVALGLAGIGVLRRRR